MGYVLAYIALVIVVAGLPLAHFDQSIWKRH